MRNARGSTTIGILTNAIDQLIGGVLGIGVNQLDNYFTRLVESGQQEKAAQEAVRIDQDLAQRGLMQDRLMSGNFNMPGMDLGGAPAIDPNSMQGKGILSSLSTMPYIDPVINKSPTHSQLAVQRGTQFIQNNPLVQQRETAQKATEQRMGLTGNMIGDAFKQNEVGFQEGLGAFDNPAGFNLTREDRNLRSQERQFGQTTAQYKAAEPFKEKSMQRSIQLKQTPGARAMGAGDSEGGAANTISPGTFNTLQKQVLRYPQYRTQTGYNAMSGQPTYELNDRGRRVSEIIEQQYTITKKPNYGEIERRAIAQEAKEYGSLSEMERARRSGSTAEQFKAFANPQSPGAATPPPTPTSAPQQQVEAVQGQKDPAIEQKISKALQMGRTPEQIKDALKADGINPAMYGL